MVCRSLLFFMVSRPQKIVIVGCGVVGALVAYELSRPVSASPVSANNIVVIDRQQPAQGSTSAALGVLMGVISSKVKGRSWRLREASIQRYPSLIAELAEQGQAVPFNSQGIVSLCFDEARLPQWETLQAKRSAQGWPLEIWDLQTLQARCPQVDMLSAAVPKLAAVKAAIYSPADAQVNPAQLTAALVAAAKARGVEFYTETQVTQLALAGSRCERVQTPQGDFAADWVILTAGLDSAGLTVDLASSLASEPLALMPVLGQAMEIELPEPLGHADFQPVINGNDIHLVPQGAGRYWLGATVEFPPDSGELIAEVEGLANLQRGAAQFCPAIAQAKIIRTWSGLRPRPVNQPAPVIQPLGENVILATGHYRNGVLLAPATAQMVCELLTHPLAKNQPLAQNQPVG
jgi:glycine oxidase